jgi:hypothetical protein
MAVRSKSARRLRWVVLVGGLAGAGAWVVRSRRADRAGLLETWPAAASSSGSALSPVPAVAPVATTPTSESAKLKAAAVESGADAGPVAGPDELRGDSATPPLGIELPPEAGASPEAPEAPEVPAEPETSAGSAAGAGSHSAAGSAAKADSAAALAAAPPSDLSPGAEAAVGLDAEADPAAALDAAPASDGAPDGSAAPATDRSSADTADSPGSEALEPQPAAAQPGPSGQALFSPPDPDGATAAARPSPTPRPRPVAVEQRFGPGSAAPLPDGSPPGPEYTIKGNAGSMLFHRPDSPYYTRTKAEVWFRTATDARAAGFTEWVPRNRTATP